MVVVIVAVVVVSVVVVASVDGAVTAGYVLAVFFRVRAASRPRVADADHIVSFTLSPPEAARVLGLAASLNGMVPAGAADATAATAPASTNSGILIVAARGHPCMVVV